MTGRGFMTLVVLLAAVVTLCQVTSAELVNLLRNPGFEEDIGDTWRGTATTLLQHTADTTEGRASLLVANRKKENAGPSQQLPRLTRGRGYEFRADIRLLKGNPDKMFQTFKAIVEFKFVHYEKLDSCKHVKGPDRKLCIKRRRKVREELRRKSKEEKQRKKEERQRSKEKQRRKKKAEKEKEKKQRREKDKKRKKKKNEKERKEKKKEKKKKKKGEQNQKRNKKSQGRKRVARDTSGWYKSPYEYGGYGEREDDRSLPKYSPTVRTPRHQQMNDLRMGSPVEESKHPLQDHRRSPPSLRPDGSRRDVSPLFSRHRRQASGVRVQSPAHANMHSDHQSPPPPISGSPQSVGKYIIAWRAWVTPESGWITLTGSINAPMHHFTSSVLHIRGPDAGCDFLVDNVTFYEIPERTDWLTESRVSIDQHRKTNVTFRVNVPPGIPRSDIDVQVRLKKHRFAFGSKVEYKMLTQKRYQKYRDIFFNLFNWATIGSFKWRFDEGTDLYEPDFSKAMEMLDILEKRGLTVRAHSILWGVLENIPDAVVATPPRDLPRLLTHHTQYMMNLTKGRVAHWDVQNELLHGHWYEETLRDPDISVKVFKEARPMDPVPKLYLNDFTAVTSGANTEDYHDMALRFIRKGSGIQGLGIQGHTKQYVKPDPTMMWRRLDRLAETGLELFMTEFDLGWPNDEERGDWFEDAIRAFFAHPGLGGVILWGFWKDIQRYQDKYLVYGEDLKFAEPGERFYCLVKKEWRTNVTFNMASVSDDVTVRAFQGDYEIIVRRKGVPVQVRNFTLGKQTKTVNIDVTGKADPVELTEERDYVPQCISHRDWRSLGVASLNHSDSRLTCVDSTADQSSASSPASHLTVTCPQGSVLIGCSSYQKDGSSRLWRGEEITVENGVASCSAIIAPNAQGMTVSARCCRQAGLKCDYRRAGPSSAMQDAMAEARCPSGYTAAGCTASSEHSLVGGAFPDHHVTSCRALNGLPLSDLPQRQSGVVSGAACCRIQNKKSLKCRAVTSQSSASDVSVTCPSDDVMTGCQAQATSGGTAGSSVTTNAAGVSTCTAHSATDHPQRNGAVVAVAICCRS